MARRKKSISKRTSSPTEGFQPELDTTLSNLLGAEVPSLRLAIEEPSPISIRINPLKGFDPGGETVPWCSTGRYLTERPSFTFDPHLHAGAYYVQEASSMFLEQAVKSSGLLDRDLLVLDLCAAPGGKTTHLRSLLSEGSLLVANEVDRKRQAALQENIWKWGHENVMITGSDPRDLIGLPDHFDLIVLDAPCSGEGMFRKDPFAREQWSPDLVERCAMLQAHIAEQAWNTLAPGGILIYCTCTWEPAENEAQLISLIEKGGISIPVPLNDEWGIVRSGSKGVHAYRFYPHRVKAEGFFLGMIRKPGELLIRGSDRKRNTRTTDIPFLLHPEAFHVIELNGIQHVVSDKWASEADRICDVLRTLAPGIPVSEIKGADQRPHPALALNRSINHTSFPVVDLDLDQAIHYLKGNSLPANNVRGTALAMHQSHPLGWLHGAGYRWNNRWPPAWRIRSQQPNAAAVAWAHHS